MSAIPDPTNGNVAILPTGELASAVFFLSSTSNPPTTADLTGGLLIGWTATPTHQEDK